MRELESLVMNMLFELEDSVQEKALEKYTEIRSRHYEDKVQEVFAAELQKFFESRKKAIVKKVASYAVKEASEEERRIRKEEKEEAKMTKYFVLINDDFEEIDIYGNPKGSAQYQYEAQFADKEAAIRFAESINGFVSIDEDLQIEGKTKYELLVKYK